MTNGPTPDLYTSPYFEREAFERLRRSENKMRAVPGDRLIIKRLAAHASARDGEILEVHGENGSPPYVVRWSDDGCVGLVFPGTDASIDHLVKGTHTAKSKEEK
jgi:Domain of unknown function (DUF1918)